MNDRHGISPDWISHLVERDATLARIERRRTRRKAVTDALKITGWVLIIALLVPLSGALIAIALSLWRMR